MTQSTFATSIRTGGALTVPLKSSVVASGVGSYRMEQIKNGGEVAFEMGNSPKVVKDHYFEIVDDRTAREYWSIKPLSHDNRKIVTMA